ncbi:MAG TPA: hypothetical protein VKR61_18050 [Bryobacteraceae bacterium]|nr:hypothetical protein [Bryobacteraceae bacterium]
MQKLQLLAGSFLFLLPALCFSQNISIVSGNGQLVCPDCASGPYKFAPLVVQVNNADGTPAPSTTVTWTVTQTGQTTITATSVTNTSGQATYQFNGLAFFFGSYYLPATVVASALNTSVEFVETSTIPGAGGFPSVFATLVTSSGAPPALSGQVGQQSATTLTVNVFTFSGAVPNLALMLVSPATGATVSCAPQAGAQPGAQPGVVLTNASGSATCTPVFGGKVGTGSYTLVVGGAFVTFGPASVTVTSGPAAMIKLISGDHQSVNLGSVAPAALTAEVTDLGGNPSSGAQVTWTVTSGTGTISSAVTTSPSTGLVSAHVTPTAGPGPVLVTVALATNKAVQYTFTVNVNTIVTSLMPISAQTEAAKIGQAFPDPIIVQANDNNIPVPGVNVSFTVTGPVTLSAASAVTNAQGQAEITATAGPTTGQATVTASITSSGKTYFVPFTLTVNPLGPIITGIFNAAGFQSQSVSPCGLAYITGSGFADNIQGIVAAFIEPQPQVAGITVALNGVLAPILDVANQSGQESLGVQIPCELQAATMPITATMIVTTDGSPSAPFDVTVSTYSPGIFETPDATDGVTRAVLLRPDGSYVSVQNPAQRGEIIRMFVTGLGQTTPALFTDELDPTVPGPNNTLLPQFPVVLASTVVGINNAGVNVISATYAFGMVGVYEVDFEVPSNTAPGNDAPFAIAIYQGTKLIYGNGSKIPIQ